MPSHRWRRTSVAWGSSYIQRWLIHCAQRLLSCKPSTLHSRTRTAARTERSLATESHMQVTVIACTYLGGACSRCGGGLWRKALTRRTETQVALRGNTAQRCNASLTRWGGGEGGSVCTPCGDVHVSRAPFAAARPHRIPQQGTPASEDKWGGERGGWGAYQVRTSPPPSSRSTTATLSKCVRRRRTSVAEHASLIRCRTECQW